jgi:CMP/dCMP kinase
VGRQVALSRGDPDDAADALNACDFPDSLLDDPALRDEATGGLASRVSIHPAVRGALFERQRDFATQAGGAVLDGRDIGTVIAPDADVKLFITASTGARAHRRWQEMLTRDPDASLATITADLTRRDVRDSGRSDAPLIAAEDAVVINTSAMGIADAIAAAIDAVDAARRGS